jgi:hypothetical protein
MGNIPSHSDSLQFRIITEKQEALHLLHSAETLDRYIEECEEDPVNHLARAHCVYQPNRVTAADHKGTIHMDQIPARLRSDLTEVQIVALMPSAEGGMPHTRPPSLICYPDLTMLSSMSTLIHELWHIHQRTNRDEWSQIFESLGWREWKGQLPDTLDRYRRFNPDTIDCPLWIYRNTWIPVPIFQDIRRPDMKQTEIWFYQPHLGYHVKSVPSELALGYQGIPKSAYEHPRELAAYLLADPNQYRDLPVYQELITLMGHTSELP